MATKQTQEGLNSIIQAISNIVDQKVDGLKYDKTYRGIIKGGNIDHGYVVIINGSEYTIKSNKNFKDFDVVRIKAPLNNFSDIYIESALTEGSGIIYFDTVDDLFSSNDLTVGLYVKTLGYHRAYDGGGAYYKIVQDSTTPSDGSYVITLRNFENLRANLVVENNEVNILQLGAQRQDADNNKYDIKPYILKYLSHLDTINHIEKLYIPAGLYTCSALNIVRSKGFYIYGDGGISTGIPQKTIITAMENQDYVIKIGDYSKFSNNLTFKDLVISSGNFEYNNSWKTFTISSYNKINQAAFIVKACSFGTFGKLGLYGIDGVAMTMDTSWECYYDLINFENINAHGKACLIFDTTDLTVSTNNVTDCSFEYLRFEQFTGNAIQFNNGNLVSNIHFGTINVEPSNCQINTTYKTDINNVTLQSYNAVINFNGKNPGALFEVDNIQLNNLLDRYYIKDNKNYAFGTIINASVDLLSINCIVSTLCLQNCGKEVILITNNGLSSSIRTNVIFSNIVNNSTFNMIANVSEFSNLLIKNSIGKFSEPLSYSSSYIPCINNYKRDSMQNKGLINYDDSSLGTNKLVLKTNATLTSTGKNIMEFILGNSFDIVAKIDNGKTLKVRLQSTDGTYTEVGSASFVGTGNYQKYNIAISNTNYIGKLVAFGTVNNNDSVLGSFDFFRT